MAQDAMAKRKPKPKPKPKLEQRVSLTVMITHKLLQLGPKTLRLFASVTA